MEFLDDDLKQSVFLNGIIKVNKDTLETKIDGIFAGGDIVSGPASVIDAVGHGRKATRSIDKFLGGDGIINYDKDLHSDNEMYIGREDGFSILEREQVNYINADKRKLNFNPFELTYDEDSAIKEGSRCLQCDLRLTFRHNPLPPEKYLKFNTSNIETVPSKEGVIQLLDEKKEVFNIKGTDNMKKTLLEILDDNNKADCFIFEADPMFTKRESELLQQFLQKYGKMPDSGDEFDDLFQKMMDDLKNKSTTDWERRNIIDNDRVSEQVEMYESIGFEVMVKDVDPEQLPEEYCKECFITTPEKYKILYTRKKEDE